jgi:hypothetical protein
MQSSQRDGRAGKPEKSPHVNDNVDLPTQLWKPGSPANASRVSVRFPTARRRIAAACEGFCHKYEKTVRKVLEFLELDTIGTEAPPPHFVPTADSISEDWAQRFRTERQAGWNIELAAARSRIYS